MERKKIINRTVVLISCKIIMLLISFFTKRLIVEFVAKEYLGINSLFSSLLSFLNLAELGLGTAVSLRLYKPLVENDKVKICSILKYVNKLYSLIGLIVFTIGLILSFFVPYLIKDNPFDSFYIQIAFFISVIGISLSYFFADKRLYYISNEEYWVTILFDTLFKFVMYLVAFIFLYFTREYIYFAAISELSMFFANISLNVLYKKQVNIKAKYDSSVVKEEKKHIFSSLYDLVPSKIGAFIFASTDSILISILLGLNDVGVYSNYLLIFNQTFFLLALVCDSLNATFGKIKQAGEEKKVLFNYFKKYLLIIIGLSLFLSVSIYMCIDDFVVIWMGKEEYVLDKTIVIVFASDFFFHSILQPYITINMAFGDLKFDKIISIVTMSLNICSSIVLGYFFGLLGIIIGTFISNLINLIVRSIYTFKKDFGKGKMKDYIFIVIMLLLWCITLSVSIILKNMLSESITNKYILLFVLGAVAIVISVPSLLICYCFLRKERKNEIFE